MFLEISRIVSPCFQIVFAIQKHSAYKQMFEISNFVMGDCFEILFGIGHQSPLLYVPSRDFVAWNASLVYIDAICLFTNITYLHVNVIVSRTLTQHHRRPWCSRWVYWGMKYYCFAYKTMIMRSLFIRVKSKHNVLYIRPRLSVDHFTLNSTVGSLLSRASCHFHSF